MRLSLPPYVFLLSDHTTLSLACEIAGLLQENDDTIMVEDFLGPIHDGLHAMFELDWKRDLGLPQNSNRLLLPALKESTEADMIKNLERWFIEQFGPHELGRIGFARAEENRSVYDYIHVFRDATPEHLVGLLGPNGPAKRDMAFIHLSGYKDAITPPSINLFIVPPCTAEEVVDRLRKLL